MKPVFESVELDVNSSIRVLHFQCGTFQQDHGWHYHPEYELSYIVKGKGTRFVGDSIEAYQSGDLVFLGPNIPHCWVSDLSHEETADNTPSSEMIVVQFSPGFLGEKFTDIPEAAALRKTLKDSARGIRYTGKDVKTISLLMSEVHQAAELQRVSLFIALLHALCKSQNKKFLSSKHHIIDNHFSHEKRMEVIIEYITHNLSNEIKQTDAAKLIDMTPQSFSRFFKAATGRTFVAFVNIMRITKACQLLTNTQGDILNISLSCGYPNISNFNRRFSEQKKMTPGEYRKKYQVLSASNLQNQPGKTSGY